GTHGAGLFTARGELLVAREDVGRHNAVDKVIGARMRRARAAGEGAFSLAGCVLVVTGRAGFEIVQKAARAGCPVVCAVSAPTTLSVDLARRAGITLAAFVRGGGMNLYAHPARVR
ncbi:MAG: formate dehydrogenase accessory sulfurtransferase FdhD, partial [Polyangiales bacterium]